MKTAIGLCAGVLLMFALLPIISPMIGLDDYRKQLPAVGELLPIGGGDSVNVYRLEPRASARPDVLIVHGRPGSGAMMLPLASALAEHGFNVVTYDRVGWAHSSRRRADSVANPTSNATELVALVKALGWRRPPLLVGYSYGGGVVQEVARIAPELALCNVLISSTGPSENATPPEPTAVSATQNLILEYAFATSWLARRLAADSMAALYYPAPPPQDNDALIAVIDASRASWLREGTERFKDFDGYAPAYLRRPSLIIHGEQDAVVPVAVPQRISASAANAQLWIMPGAGHAAAFNQAHEIAERIADFATRSCECNTC